MRVILLFTLLPVILLNLSCSNSVDSGPLPELGLSGTIKDTLGNPIPDVKVFLIFHFNTYPLPGINNGHPALSDSLPQESSLSLIYPNPFVAHMFFEYQLRTTSDITFNIYDFNDNLVTSDYLVRNDQQQGYYGGVIQGEYPSGGYKLKMEVKEPGSSAYAFESEFLVSNPDPPEAVTHTTPNAVSTDNGFTINYDKIPFGRRYYHIPRFSSDPDSVYEVNNTLTIVLYSYYHQLVVQDVVIDPRYNKEMEFEMIPY